MCVWVIPAITAAMGVVNAVAGQRSAKAENAMLEYNAQTARNNAALARQEAAHARLQAGRNAAAKGRATSALIGAQRARMGASGAVVDSGSFLDVTLSLAEEGAKDATALLEQGDLEAWRHETTAANYERQSAQALAARKNTGAVLGAGLLSAGSAAVISAISLGAGSGFGSTPAAGSGGIGGGAGGRSSRPESFYKSHGGT